MKNSVRTCFIKVSSFSILFVIVMFFWTVAYASETGISIQEPNISIADGNFVFEVYASGYQNSNYSAEAIVATYDEDGNLLSARRKNLSTLGEARITLPVTKTESYYKIMIFDLEEELTPLCKALKNNIDYSDYAKIKFNSDYIKTIADNSIEYYYSPFNSSKTDVLTLDNECELILNGAVADLSSLLKYKDVIVEAEDTDLDGEIEHITAQFYRYGFVDSVDEQKNIITVSGYAVELPFDNENKHVILENSNQDKLAVSNFKVGDFVAIASDNTLSFENYTDYIKIVRLDNSILTGIADSMYTQQGNWNFCVISGNEYIIESCNDFKVGDEGCFYIGLTNRIHYFLPLDNLTKGYILEATLSDAPFSNDFWQVKLLTGGGIVIYDVTRDITEEFTGFLASCFNEEKQEYLYGDYEFSLNRLISFDTNSDGELTEYKQTYDNSVPISGAYDADSNKIGNTILNENLIIYDVSKKEVNDTRIINVDSLKDEVIYSGMVFCNSLGICETMVITEVSYQLSESSGFGIVERITGKKDSQGYDVIEITYIQDESEKVAIFDDNSSCLGEIRFENASVGDVLVIFSEENETVDTYGFLGKVNNGLFELNRSLMDDVVTNKNTEYVYGYITNENMIKVSKGEIITLNRSYDVLITDESNKYTYNDSGRVVNIEIGDFTADYYYPDTNRTSAVFLKVVDGVAKDVYSFNKRVTVPDGYDESIELYDKINYILAEIDKVYATGEFNFPEKTETIIPKLEEAMNEISFWWNENIIISVNLIRSTYSDLLNEIRTTLNSLTPEEKNEFTTELNTKLSASCLNRIAEIFDINAIWN